MSVPARRIHRYGTLVHQWLAKFLIEEVSDPVVQNLHVTDVEMTPDLKEAKVFYLEREGVSGEAAVSSVSNAELKKALKRATPFLRRRMGQDLELRSIPELRFYQDEHSKRVDKLVTLMDNLKGDLEVLA